MEEDVIKSEIIDREFTTLEVLYPIWWLKPFLYCFSKTSKLKNKDYFQQYYDMIIYGHFDYLNLYHKILKINKFIIETQKNVVNNELRIMANRSKFDEI